MSFRQASRVLKMFERSSAVLLREGRGIFNTGFESRVRELA